MRNIIYIGSNIDPSYTFDNDSTFSVSVNQKVALVGQTFSYDTLTAVVADDYANLVDLYRFRSSDGQEIVSTGGSLYCIDVGEGLDASDLLNLAYGTPVWYYQNDALIGKFYLDNVSREAKNQYKLECVSAVGILDKLQHGGGLFTPSVTPSVSTFGALLQHILASGLHGEGSPVIEYEIDQKVADINISGWLPYATKRDNLYQLLFAYGVNIVKDIYGNPRFTFVCADPNAEEIKENIIYNEGSVTYTKPYSGVSVSEHTYTPVTTLDPETLFDNSTGAALNDEEIWFSNAPIIKSTLVASSGLTIVSSTENSAVLRGNGVLTGVPYTHTVRRNYKPNPNVSEEKIIDVTDCTMVNLGNSNNLVNRLYAFYCPANRVIDGVTRPGRIELVKGSFKYTEERCGKAYSLKNKFGEDVNAYLSTMNLTASSFNKAECEFYANYNPAGQEGLYVHVDPIPDPKDPDPDPGFEGEWIVPEGVTEFDVVLISGGTGGGSGWPGKNGDDAQTFTDIEQTADLSSVWYGAEGGDGGAGGAGGLGGKIRIIHFSNAVPGTTYYWTRGRGGEGGASTGFIKDTIAELREALRNEQPDTEYTDAQIQAMIDQENSNWNGTPNTGSAGTATTFSDGSTIWSTEDPEAYTSLGGFYDYVRDRYFALPGYAGIKGGKGGARKIERNGSFNWVTDGEDVTGDDGTVYRGGSTGRMLTDVAGLPEAAGKVKAYGGNGAGAAVGIDRAMNEHINGGFDQETSWDIVQDEN